MSDGRSRVKVRLFGHSESECGYCKGKRSGIVGKTPGTSSRAYAMLCNELEPELYERLLRRGWRRSGVALYKPDNWESCCPAISIRMPVDRFRPTKSQRKIKHKMESLLRLSAPKNPRTSPLKKKSYRPPNPVETYIRDSGTVHCLNEGVLAYLKKVVPPEMMLTPEQLPPFKLVNKRCVDVNGMSLATYRTTACAAVAGRSKGTIDRNTLATGLVVSLRRTFCPDTMEDPPCQCDEKSSRRLDNNKRFRVQVHCVCIKKVYLHEKSGQIMVDLAVFSTDVSKIAELTTDVSEDSHDNKDRLAEWWNKPGNFLRGPLQRQGGSYTLTVTTVPAHESALDVQVHQLYWNYQHIVHGDADPMKDEVKPSHVKGEEEETSLEEWASNAPSGWKAKVESMLNETYGNLSEDRRTRLKRAFISFYDFLVDNPFDNIEETLAGDQFVRCGAYHQHYRIANGHLIAVGVVDVLPSGLSSVYLYYDASFADHLVPLGKFSILREIEWTQQAKLPYYYLGYYIQSCQKMRYKADYHPSELLCPTTYTWVDAEEGKRKIRTESPVRNCCTLSTESCSTLSSMMNDATLDSIELFVGMEHPVTLGMLTPEGKGFVQPLLEDFVEQAGIDVAQQCTVDLGS